MTAGPFYLHEVVCPLHLGHEVLHSLLSDHRVIGRRGSDVHSNGWFRSQQCWRLVLEGIHHLWNTQKHVTDTQREYVNATSSEISRVTFGIVVMVKRIRPEPPLSIPPLALCLYWCMLFLE